MLILSTADPLGSLFGEGNVCHSPVEGIEPHCTITVTLGVLGLWYALYTTACCSYSFLRLELFRILNIAINVVQGPARAIVADLVNTEQQTKANSILTGVMGLSNLFGNLLGRFVPAQVLRVLELISEGFFM